MKCYFYATQSDLFLFIKKKFRLIFNQNKLLNFTMTPFDNLNTYPISISKCNNVQSKYFFHVICLICPCLKISFLLIETSRYFWTLTITGVLWKSFQIQTFVFYLAVANAARNPSIFWQSSKIELKIWK